MRFNPEDGEATAAQLLNRAPQADAGKDLLGAMGKSPEVRRRPLARLVVQARQRRPFCTTQQQPSS